MNGGFTLLEAMVALVVLAIVVGVVLETQLTTLNMEQAARATFQARMENDRVFTEVRLGTSPENILAAVSPESAVTIALTSLSDTEDAADCLRWDIVSQVRPSLSLTLITRSFE